MLVLMYVCARTDVTETLHARCHCQNIPSSMQPKALVVTSCPHSTHSFGTSDVWLRAVPPLWLISRTSNLLKRTRFSVSRINNLNAKAASFSAFLWPSPAFRSLGEKLEILDFLFKISFELKSPNQNQWTVWFAPLCLQSQRKLFKICFT